MNNKHTTINTCYGPIQNHILSKAKNIKLLICDSDGVMSDGMIYHTNNGNIIQRFNVKDGYGIRCLLKFAIEVGIITGNQSQMLKDRCSTLGISYIYQGQSNKIKPFHDILSKLNLSEDQIAYIGDDLIDLPILLKVGLSIAVADAHPMVLPHVDYITKMNGGNGAIREIADLILIAQNKILRDFSGNLDGLC
ncbi:3-deoxy-D-manno-octulosonate 8-phosphate phosphatase KdsC [Candidatus Erwinia haradaeae]|uniref:3-deoxy-D-manno-octulosonate 8-phosphate phosphatase KdsC n=1 Tax=Candidatus Erwinia haradaeae TaxID=1922217 RepID=A0A451D027_9GAMM|nr:3-deoxy-manno-octulosonate-8-phosphatase KdsC [Candidatus Erwinia haradaeae]VFP78976.1 3-deoxy-D-manno-octulosonate 8-phosphate phosphatase KdsC [Candidatus Erwinia haradaeae]